MITRLLAISLLAAVVLLSQDTKYPPQGQQLPGPPAKSDTADWLKQVRQWRDEARVRAGLTGDQYGRKELEWAQRSFIQPQAMIEDRYFYDPEKQQYTVDRYLDDVDRRYGGIDSILLWPVYPNIGIDNRNQFDMLRDMPGGIPALKRMVEDFHKRGVRVLFPTMPWDMGTRLEPLSKPEAIAKLLAEIGADGVNGDTFGGVPRTYRVASDKTGHPLVFEPEGYPTSDEMLNWNNMSWGYWKYPFVPMISRGKWLEPRHFVNVCDRWNRDKTDNLQAAFFNGAGYESWENIWGIWNGITERDAETIRRIAKIERRFAGLLTSADWEPHTATVQYGVFASKWPEQGRTLWTIVNRNEYAVEGRQLQLPVNPNIHYYDLWHGTELNPAGGGQYSGAGLPHRRARIRRGAGPGRTGRCVAPVVPGRDEKIERRAVVPIPENMEAAARSTWCQSNKPSQARSPRKAWSKFPAQKNFCSKCMESKLKAATKPASTCNIRGITTRAATIRTRWRSRRFTSTNIP